jgi:hypothetical protein
MRAEWVGMGTGWRLLSGTESWYEGEGCEDSAPVGSSAVPDLSDPATLGCLLALVREAWGQDDLAASRFAGQWCVEHTPAEGPHRAWYGPTEAAALVAALEAAP